MKNLFLCFVMIFTISSVVTAQQNKTAPENKAEKEELIQEKADGAIIEFKETIVDYGTLEKGGDPYRVFSFVNIGTEPLIIKNAKGSCGCTVPSIPKEPVMPGESGEIKVRYDTNRVGRFTKTIRVTSNAETSNVTLTIKGNVTAAEPEESAPAKENGVF